MKIESLKDLESLVKLCRKQGIDKITVDGITFELGSQPVRKGKTDDKEPEVEQPYTDDEVATWSVA